MPKTPTPKWAVIATQRRYSLHIKKGEADEALVAWKQGHEAHGCEVKGSKSGGYFVKRPGEDVATMAARVVKLADHPICYIGVFERDVQRLREMETAGNTDFEGYSDLAKTMSAEWSHVEAV